MTRVVPLHVQCEDCIPRYCCGRPADRARYEAREAEVDYRGLKWRYCLLCRRARERDPRKHHGTLPRA